MNKEQFIYWLKGFAKAVNEEGPTPKQWETIVSELDKIKDCPDYSSPIEEFKPNPIWQEPHYVNPWDKYPMWQEPHYVNPWDKYKITCQPGDTNLTITSGSGTTSGSGVIVTDGFIQNSSITRAQPPFTLTTSSTAYGHVSGSTVSYTVKDKE
jgi:hypothetical protein